MTTPPRAGEASSVATALAPASANGTGWRSEAAAMLRLALPVVLVQVGMMAMGVVDTMMVGRVSDVDLAAVHIGHAYSFFFLGLGMGLLMALDALVSQAFGAGDSEGVSRALQRGVLIALVISVPIALAILPVERALVALGQAEAVVPVAAGYALRTVPGVPFFLLFVVFRHTLQAMHVVRPITWTIALANLANVGLNWALVFGHLGFEPMGALGAAWATSICRGLMAVFVLVWGWRWLGPHLRPLRPGAVRRSGVERLVRLGLPVSMQVGAEVGAFGVMSMMVGRMGATVAAGSSIVLNLASLSFMLPLGLSIAASVRVGNAIGRADEEGMRRAARVALVIGPGVMAVFGLLFFVLPETLAGLYSPDLAVVAVAVSLLPIAAFFQVFDGLQVVTTGILRGAGDTRLSMYVHLAGFWLIGLPIGAWLGLRGGREDPAGIWWGITAGLIAVGLVLLVRVRVHLSGAIERVDAEGSGSTPLPAE